MEFLGAALVSVLLFLVALAWIWLWPKELLRINQRVDLTEREKRAVKNQIKVLAIGIPVFILFSLSIRLLGRAGDPDLAVLDLLIGFAIVIYVAVSSMVNRISIFGGLGSGLLRGKHAVWAGFGNIALVLIVFVLFMWYLLKR